MKKEPMNVHVVIDRSGSMQSIRDDAIGGFNSFLNDTRATHQRWWVWLFDTRGIDLLQENVPASKVRELDEATYVPRASTPLYDAVGMALARAREARKTKRNILMVLTDGKENSSREWSSRDVKKELTRLSKEENWQVIFVATGAEAWAETDAFDMGAVIKNRRSGRSLRGAYGSAAAVSADYAEAGAARSALFEIGDDGEVISPGQV